MTDTRRSNTSNDSAHDMRTTAKIDAMIDSALNDRPLERLPRGFVDRTMELVTGHPPFRLRPMDVGLPLVFLGIFGVVLNVSFAVVDRAGPLWLQRAFLWTVEAWPAWSPLPPPSPVTSALLFGCFAALATAWAATHGFGAPRRSLRR